MAAVMAPRESDRADAMGRRLDRTARRLGIPADGRTLMAESFRAAMHSRRTRIRDDHHPDYLHPARTALILMDDAAVAEPAVLAVGLLAETRDPTLAAAPDRVARLGAGLTEALERLPHPPREGHRLLETLLSLPDELARVAVAERLDHARHLHLRERPEWGPYHAVTCDAYAPVAVRVDPALGERLGWWCQTFHRRFLAS